MELLGSEIVGLLASPAVLIAVVAITLVLLSGMAANALLFVEDLRHRWEGEVARSVREGGAVRCEHGRRAEERSMRALLGPWASSRMYAEFAYLALAFPLGLAYFVFLVTGVSVGAGLIVVWVGVPMLLGMLLSWRALGQFERLLHRSLLGVEIDDPHTSIRGDGSLWQRTKRLLEDSVTWRTLLWLLIRFPAGIIVFVVLVTFLATSLGLIALGAGAALGLDYAEWSNFLEWDGLDGAVDERFALLVGGLLLLALPPIVRGLAWFHAVVGAALLGPSLRDREQETPGSDNGVGGAHQACARTPRRGRPHSNSDDRASRGRTQGL